ncbi:ROK family transcriptional regulator [Planctomonas sp. JC2975]|uniref:ROK family protein n=1 Tax=Planctomonas sp. JC2975 TaxID=2729626 RepID=UPI001475F9EA|nr:ROK family protein [Planctomonas sp. JC2975]NNC11748.1 ROK family transcriptional regulator [Planctomonas sp. JC2975]
MRAGTNLPAVGGYNQAVVMDAVRRSADGVSRVEVATSTGLSAQTVTNVVRRLIDDGLIVEDGTRATGVGKPRTILRLQPRGRLALGVHLDPSVITVVLLDLAGSVVAHRTIPTPLSATAPKTLQRIVRAASTLLTTAGIEPSRIIGLGIAAPGPVDVDTGVVLDPPLLPGWRNVPVRDELAERLGLPVLLEKDVTAAAVAELWMDTDGQRNNMLFFYYGTGVGAGIVVHGEVVRGSSNNAGDIGNMVVGGQPGDPGHRRWRLGDAVLPRFLVADAIERGILDGDARSMTTAEVRAAFTRLADARTSDERAASLLRAVAEDTAVSLVTLVNALDVDHVVFGGPFFAPLRDYLLATVPPLVNGSPIMVMPHPITFTESAIGEDVTAIGAACLVLDHALTPKPAGLLIRR